LRYRAEIDGLRAVAVLPVIFFHAGLDLFSGGFVGVDIFFVISGYLITTILIEDVERGRFSLLRFYEKRARRILPALIVVLCTIAFIAWLVMLPDDFKKVTDQLISNAAFLSNVHYTLTWGYFESWALPPVFLNTWSLAVEEQFYLFFPLLVFAFRRRPSEFTIFLLITFVCSLLWAEFASRLYPVSTYYLLPSRFWEMAAGALVAQATRSNGSGNGSMVSFSRFRDAIAGAAFVCLLLSYFLIDESKRYPSLVTAIPVLSTAAFIYFCSERNFFSHFLSTKFMVYIGKISYPLYLWHFPVLILIKYVYEPFLSSLVIGVLTIFITFLLSVATYVFVELPFRERRIGATRTSIFALASVSLSLIFVAGLLGHQDKLMARSVLAAPELRHLTEKAALPNSITMDQCAARDSSAECQISSLENRDGKGRRHLLISGDSFAANLISPVSNLLVHEDKVAVSARITYACSFMPSGFDQWGGECGKARQKLEEIDPNEITDVLFHINFVGRLIELEDKERVRNLDSLTDLFSKLLSKGVKVQIVSHRDIFSQEPARSFIFPWIKSLPLNVPDVLSEYYRKWEMLGVVVHRRSNLAKSYSPHLMYSDIGHLSPQGSEMFLEGLGIVTAEDLLSL
tara:strand:+ start:4208 stop:6091 length:1884 start_codon:yes stop_codon:yes gene_type:complete